MSASVSVLCQRWLFWYHRLSDRPAHQPSQNSPNPAPKATLGGRPEPSVDDPILAVFIVFYLAGAIFNMTVFQLNRRRSHKFPPSAVLFSFCMARTAASIMRIVWASHPNNTSIVTATQILTNAGVVLLFIVDIILAQRLFRAHQPYIGWCKPVSLAFAFIFFSIVACFIIGIVTTVLSVTTDSITVLSQIRDISLFTITYLAILAFLPVLIVGLGLLLPRKAPVDEFGQGPMRSKVILVVFNSLLLTLGAGFRAGVSYEVRPATAPAWFHHKACFYIFNFVLELVVVYLYALSRFDRCFYIPDGSSGPGDYSKGLNVAIGFESLVYRVDTEPKS